MADMSIDRHDVAMFIIDVRAVRPACAGAPLPSPSLTRVSNPLIYWPHIHAHCVLSLPTLVPGRPPLFLFMLAYLFHILCPYISCSCVTYPRFFPGPISLR